MKHIRLLVLVLVTLTAGSPLYADEPQTGFTPRNGFGGRSEGDGSLRLFAGRPRPFHVESSEHGRGDGAFQLDQTVTFQGKKPQDRSWVITPAGPGRFAGTLSDAAGPVAGRTDGDRMTLRYRVAGPFVMHQTLERGPDGRTTENRGRITLLGVPVGRLRETITRKD